MRERGHLSHRASWRAMARSKLSVGGVGKEMAKASDVAGFKRIKSTAQMTAKVLMAE